MKLLEVRDLTFGYEDAPVLDKFNMELLPQEILLLDGEDGAGKTTLLKCIANIINNGVGIFINGTNVEKDKTNVNQISFVMGEDTLYDYLTVDENIRFFKSLFDESDDFIAKARNTCSEFGIEKYENYLVQSLSQKIRHKLYLAIMLSKQHNILMLDEPFVTLDKRTQRRLMTKIKKTAKDSHSAVILVTNMNEFKSFVTRTVQVNKIVN